MSPERVRHNESKGNVYSRCVKRFGAKAVPRPRRWAVRIDETTVYEPNALVR